MLYGILGGLFLFLIILYFQNLIANRDNRWFESTEFDEYFSFPDGTQYEYSDSHGGFLGDGISIIIAQIPAEASQEFTELLKKRGFVESPLPEKLHYQLMCCSEICMVANISKSLWWFHDDSSGKTLDWFTNYTLHLYDLEKSVYYYIKYDS